MEYVFIGDYSATYTKPDWEAEEDFVCRILEHMFDIYPENEREVFSRFTHAYFIDADDNSLYEVSIFEYDDGYMVSIDPVFYR